MVADPDTLMRARHTFQSESAWLQYREEMAATVEGLFRLQCCYARPSMDTISGHPLQPPVGIGADTKKTFSQRDKKRG